jgi:hypothetical protein
MSHKFRKPKPISDARRAAARANGAKSHGPVTPEGKAKSALNAVTHGLTAGTVVLTTENREKYEALLASYRDEYDPQGQTENDLVDELAAAKWLHGRALSMITSLLDVTMDRMDREIKEEFEKIGQRHPHGPGVCETGRSGCDAGPPAPLRREAHAGLPPGPGQTKTNPIRKPRRCGAGSRFVTRHASLATRFSKRTQAGANP